MNPPTPPSTPAPALAAAPGASSAPPFPAVRLPLELVILLLLACGVPPILGAMGVQAVPLPAGFDPLVETARFPAFLDWMALGLALGATGLAWVHYRVTRETQALLIALTTASMTVLDALHSLLVIANGGSEYEIALRLCAAYSRAFSILLLIIGATISRSFLASLLEGALAPVFMGCAAFLVVGLGAVWVGSTTISKGLTPDSHEDLARIWAVLPFLLLAYVAFNVLQPLDRERPTATAHGLLLSVVPLAASQYHLCRGLFATSGRFHLLADGYELIAVALPALGLVIDILRTLETHDEKMLGTLDEKVNMAVASLQPLQERVEKLQKERAEVEEVTHQIVKLYQREAAEKKVAEAEKTKSSSQKRPSTPTILPKDLLSLLRYCLRKSEGVLLSQETRFANLREQREAAINTRDEAVKEADKMRVFYRRNPQPGAEFSSDGYSISYNDATYSIVKRLGNGTLKNLLPNDYVEVVKSCLKTGKSSTGHEVVAGNETLSWGFFPDITHNTVFAYIASHEEQAPAPAPGVAPPAAADPPPEA